MLLHLKIVSFDVTNQTTTILIFVTIHKSLM